MPVEGEYSLSIQNSFPTQDILEVWLWKQFAIEPQPVKEKQEVKHSSNAVNCNQSHVSLIQEDYKQKFNNIKESENMSFSLNYSRNLSMKGFVFSLN